MENPTPISSIPLGRAFHFKELLGRLSKYLETPPGRRGVVLGVDGRTRLLPPGKATVLSAWERLQGKGAGLAAGYVPGPGSLPAWLKALNLFSGDGVLLDALLLCQVQVSDPGRFFVEQVLPRGTLPGPQLELSAALVSDSLAHLAKNYAADDLVCGLPNARLLPEVRTLLELALQDQGLRLESLQLVSFSRSEDRAEIAEKLVALHERLQDAELQRQMIEAEARYKLEDFLNQLDPVLVQAAGLRLETPGQALPEAAPATQQAKPAQPASGRPPLPELLRRWFQVEQQPMTQGRFPFLERLFRREKKELPEPPRLRRKPQRWWLRRALWMGFVLLAAYGLTRVVLNFAEGKNWGGKWELVGVIWIFALTALLESVKVLYETHEELNARQFAEPGTTFLDDLTGNDRPKADALVRRQCAQDLHHIRTVIDDLRTRVYKLDNVPLALRLRDLQRKVETVAVDVQDARFGRPPYLDDLKISRVVWEDMLDEDEQLLVRSAALNSDAQALQQAQSEGGLDAAWLERFEGRLDAFHAQFAARSRALKPGEKEQRLYRMEIS